jgi:FkbM family methyltransferase
LGKRRENFKSKQMRKILQLNRLNFKNALIVLKYLVKRVFKIKTSTKEREINDYYFHLIKFNGFLKNENENSYLSYYPKFNSTIKLRKRPSSDLNVFSQIYFEKEYKPLAEKFIQTFKTENNLNIIDAGSNIGLTSVYLSKIFLNSKFIVIEPDQANYDILSFNLDANKVNSVKLKAGLWYKDCFLKIIRDFRDKSDWSIRVEETNLKTDLEAISINSIIEKNDLLSIDILKIDIEGSEKELFLNKNNDLSFLNFTKCIAIEIHDEFNCRQEIYNLLSEYNFDFFNSGELTIGVNKTLI